MNDDLIASAVAELRAAKAALTAAEQSVQVWTGEALARLAEAGTDTWKGEVDGHRVTATAVRPTRLVFDEVGLAEHLGTDRWEQVSVRKLDRKLLEQAVADAVVAPVEVAAHSDEQPTRPYVKLTEK